MNRCPVPRRSKFFPFLQVVNELIITQQNIIDLTGRQIEDIRVNWEKMDPSEKKTYIKLWNTETKKFDFNKGNDILKMVEKIGRDKVQKERDILVQKNKKRRLSKKKGVKVSID